MNSNDKHYLFNRDNLTQPIQMQLSQKQNTFSQFFFFFLTVLKSILNFIHFPKRNDLDIWSISGITGPKKLGYINVLKVVYHRTLRQTTWQMGRKAVGIQPIAPLQYSLIFVKVITLKKVAFSDIQNPKTVSQLIDCRWQAFSA